MGKSKRKNQKLRRSKKQKKHESKKRRIKRKKAIITKRRKRSRAPDYYTKWDDIVIPEDVLVMPGDRPPKRRKAVTKKKRRKRGPDYYTKWDSVFIPDEDIVMPENDDLPPIPAEDDPYEEDDIVMPPPPEEDLDDMEVDLDDDIDPPEITGELESKAPSIYEIGHAMEGSAGALDRAERWLQEHFQNLSPEDMDELSYDYYNLALGDWYDRYRRNRGPWRQEMNNLRSQMSKYFKKDGSLREQYVGQEIEDDDELEI